MAGIDFSKLKVSYRERFRGWLYQVQTKATKGFPCLLCLQRTRGLEQNPTSQEITTTTLESLVKFKLIFITFKMRRQIGERSRRTDGSSPSTEPVLTIKERIYYVYRSNKQPRKVFNQHRPHLDGFTH